MVEEQRIEENNLKSAPTSTTVKKQTTPGAIHPRIVSKPTKTEPIPVADGYCSVPKRHSKLQSLVDLVMWRDESRSAFIFGMGTSVIMSSSYTTDLNKVRILMPKVFTNPYVYCLKDVKISYV
ncbi:uncharacterized protein LOC141700929 [Apium graveolens]